VARKITISMGADHGGFILKEELKKYLKEKGYRIKDVGTNSVESCDYPLFGYEAARAVSARRADRGIVICKTGFGMAIIANKVKGIRCAVCDSAPQAKSARRHNSCNVLALAAKRVKRAAAKKIVDAFLSEEADIGRHRRRVNQIINLERKQ